MMGDFYGVPGIEFIWHGDQNDPECAYKGMKFDYYDLEDPLWEDYNEDCNQNGEEPSNVGFEDWIAVNHDLVYYYADNIIERNTHDVIIPLDSDYEGSALADDGTVFEVYKLEPAPYEDEIDIEWREKIRYLDTGHYSNICMDFTVEDLKKFMSTPEKTACVYPSECWEDRLYAVHFQKEGIMSKVGSKSKKSKTKAKTKVKSKKKVR